jgi:subtilisin family serine protease
MCNNGCGTTPSAATYTAGIASSASSNNQLVSYLNGQSLLANTILTNSVITKAAGNGNIPAQYDTTSLALSQNASTLSRLLIVGALNNVGTTSAPASLASYSNYAGTNTAIQNRFLLESGTVPFGTNAIAVNGNTIASSGNDGTSYAAPRVAGYAAIVMQKFPNLSAANTSNILLDTARYDTLTCNPNCDPAIYGKGEASLSRALAPVGRLR